jgi:hypothetical protein
LAETSKIAVLVLGMHRSGTSAFARVISLLGAELPQHLMPAARGNNEAGFWESKLVAEFDDQLLSRHGVRWDSFLPLSELPADQVAGLKATAAALLKTEYGDASILVLKEPRMCRLLPFWRVVLEGAGYQAACVVPIRNPLEVAGSLQARDGLPRSTGLLLWARYVLDAVRHSTGLTRLPLRFDDLLEQTGKTVDVLRSALGPYAAAIGDDGTSQISTFLSRRLRHQQRSWDEFFASAEVPALVKEVGDLVLSWCDEWQLPVDAEAERLALEWDDAQSLFGDVLADWDRRIHALCVDAAGHHKLIAELRADEIHNAELATRVVSALQDELMATDALVEVQKDRIEVQKDLIEAQKDLVEQYKNSTSWRITRPLRQFGTEVQAIREAWRGGHLYFGRNRREVEPGSATAAAQDGTSAAVAETMAEAPPDASSQRPAAGVPKAVDVLEEVALPVCPSIADVAVHVHAYYPEMLGEIASYLANIPVPFALYVTVADEEAAGHARAAFGFLQKVRELVVEVVENRGRDIAPMVVTLGRRLRNHHLVLHIHTKRSPHNADLAGWREYLFRALLGSPATVAAIIERFGAEERLGILYPAHYYPVQPFVRLGANALHMAALLLRAGEPISRFRRIAPSDFPSGAMFWFRGDAIGQLAAMRLEYKDFQPEAGQDDGTLAHAIERMLPFLAALDDLSTRAYLPAALYSDLLPGALPFSADALRDATTESPVLNVVFDHDVGGGANRYGRSLIDAMLSRGELVARVFRCSRSGALVVQVIAGEHGMYYAAASLGTVIAELEKIRTREVVVNSLYGHPDVSGTISRIIDLARKTGGQLQYKLHDFLAVCPSQHLLDQHLRYCGVPSDDVCKACLPVNPSAAHEGGVLRDIDEWRQPFRRLFAEGATITAFDSSAVEILGRAFDLRHCNVQLAPHDDDYFVVLEPPEIGAKLHIGMLGTLTAAKGAAVLNNLASYIRESGADTPITVIGASMEGVRPGVTVLGPYDVSQLVDIVQRQQISVFFLASIIPETFSYSLSEIMKMGMPVVAFDIGAQGRRIAGYEKGRLVPLGSPPAVILEALREAWHAARGETAEATDNNVRSAEPVGTG